MNIRSCTVGVTAASIIFAAALLGTNHNWPSTSVNAGALLDPVQTTIIADGLHNPRGLNFGPDGGLYVAEAGTGGPGPCADGPEGWRCYGPSGSISRIDLRDGTVTRVVTGLISLADGDGNFATGIHDISYNGLGNGYATIGWAGDPAGRTVQFGQPGADLARIARINASGKWEMETDLGSFEAIENPNGDEIDTNPYGVLSLPGRHIIADAGANDLLEINANGSISVLGTFPNRSVTAPEILGFPSGTTLPADAVPTSVAMGPDGDLYIGQLVGFPFPVDEANVYRVPASGGTPVVAAGGFTAVVDVTFGPDGSMYVLEMATNGLLAGFIFNDWTGALFRIKPDGTRTEIAPGALTAPGGIAVGKDGTVYVTNNSTSGNSGAVLIIRP